ncbi:MULTISPECIES: 50S ribosomal protein L18Ae [Haloarchaeobius]|jgi:large subunit ribosomal protein LX|uniref:Large ribosomal subunit protein eL20 n=1 Tax=Haloarchaeobius litoreus TaxID=755306 RepID=A0ABD6DL34_9EURY|nr:MULTISPECIES: 50S ribosomal protein L18Ae [Haloarchaeobius]
MSQFTVRGTFQAREGDRPFETTVEAPNENVARERTFATFGSQHNLKRAQMDVTEVEAQ